MRDVLFLHACSRSSARVIFGNTRCKKGLQKVDETSPLDRPGMIRIHPSRRIFNVCGRITLLIETVKGFYENVVEYFENDTYVQNKDEKHIPC